jgi:tetratricopeptide (TPR) repeat protein
MTISTSLLRRLRAPCWSAALGAGLLAGCSITDVARKDAGAPSAPQMPQTSVVSVPGSPEFAGGKELKNPDKVQLAYARWQEQQRQPALAREAYQKVLDHDPKSVEALLGLSRLDQLAGRTPAAVQHLEQAQKLQPNNPLVYAAWGEFYAAQQNWPLAIERYRHAVDLAPDELLYKHQLAVVMVKSGAIADGLNRFTALVGAAEAHYNVALLLSQQGRNVEAQDHLQRALAVKPELTPASNLLTRLQRERGHTPAVAAAAPVARPAIQPAAPATTAAMPVIKPDFQPAAPASTASAPVAHAGWTAASHSKVQPAAYTPQSPSPQQVEQWRNQQSPDR